LAIRASNASSRATAEVPTEDAKAHTEPILEGRAETLTLNLIGQ
jgi:hypothetical protein